MRIHRIVAAVGLSLSCAVCSASCVQSPEAALGTEGDIGGEPLTEGARGEGEPVAEAEEALFGTIRCRKSEYGMDCADRCGNAGMFCADLKPHPYKRDVGVGAASRCDGNAKVTTCWYYYVGNGDTCRFFSDRRPPLCVYDGG